MQEFAQKKTPGGVLLLYCHRFGEVAGLVDVTAFDDGDVIGQQ